MSDELEMIQEPRKHSTSAVTLSRHTRFLPKDFRQLLDAIQRLVCLGLACWYLVTKGDWFGFAIIMAIGQMDAKKAKEVLIGALRGVIDDKH
jgi:hypothetical protein